MRFKLFIVRNNQLINGIAGSEVLYSSYNKMENKEQKTDNLQGNGVLPCVSGSICCPLCGSENYEEYDELMYENGMDDPQYGGELKMAKITYCHDCG